MRDNGYGPKFAVHILGISGVSSFFIFLFLVSFPPTPTPLVLLFLLFFLTFVDRLSWKRFVFRNISVTLNSALSLYKLFRELHLKCNILSFYFYFFGLELEVHVNMCTCAYAR